MKRLPSLAIALTALATVCLTGSAHAQEYTFKLHHFLPTSSITHAELIEPWARRVEKDSGSRIRIRIFPSMQLGGRAPELYDQALDGVVDIVWTLPGYTAGRFPLTEVFELPFVPVDAEATSRALHQYYEKYAREEFAGVKVLALHNHYPGSFHTRRPVRRLEDLAGMSVRAPNRVGSKMLEKLGAVPVGMPVPEVASALSRGVIDGTLLPFEVVLPLKIYELVQNHTETVVNRGFYTAVFAFVMNRKSYESLPPDLQRVIDDNSGLGLATRAGKIWQDAEDRARQVLRERGNKLYLISGVELERWKRRTRPVIDEWIADIRSRGHDGARLVRAARRLIIENQNWLLGQ